MVAIIVRLTERQLNAVLRTVSPLLHDYLSLDSRILAREGKMLELQMIPDAWLAVFDEMVTSFGRSFIRASSTQFAAAKRIGTEVNRRRTHPAFKGAAMFGHEVESFPAWKPEVAHLWPFKPHRLVSPVEPLAADFVVLGPKWSSYKGEKITTWAETDVFPTPNPIFQRSTYEEFYALSKMSTS